MSPNVAASVRQRLLNLAKDRGEEFEFTLTRFAAERFLFRLGASRVRGRFLLKGAALLSIWLPDPYRTTRDVDLLLMGRADEDSVRDLIREVCSTPCPEDGLEFDLSGLVFDTIRPEDKYPGKRARFHAFLGKARIRVQVDIGVEPGVAVSPEEVAYPVLLSSLPAPRVPAYPRELTVAEKFEAMVRLGIRNSRMKDFHDVWALAGSFSFEGTALQGAIASCFGRRGTPLKAETPRVLTRPFYRIPELEDRWRHYLAAGAVLVLPPGRFETIGERIVRFLSPVRESLVLKAEFRRDWPPGGPWR